MWGFITESNGLHGPCFYESEGFPRWHWWKLQANFSGYKCKYFSSQGEKPALKNHKGNGLIFGDCIVSL